MMAEQERLESKRRQTQGIQLAKEKGVYKGRPMLYCAEAKDPQKRLIYHEIVRMLKAGEPIKKIAEITHVTGPLFIGLKASLQEDVAMNK